MEQLLDGIQIKISSKKSKVKFSSSVKTLGHGPSINLIEFHKFWNFYQFSQSTSSISSFLKIIFSLEFSWSFFWLEGSGITWRDFVIRLDHVEFLIFLFILSCCYRRRELRNKNVAEVSTGFLGIFWFCYFFTLIWEG